MKLQSHKDYENEIDKPEFSDADFRALSRKHREFISKRLELGQFIPCVDNVPLEEPTCEWCRTGSPSDCHRSKECAIDETPFLKYQNALEDVLFEGFEYKHDSLWLFDGFNSRIIYTKNNGFDYRTIEDLIQYNLTLTESAKQQLK